MLQNFFLKQYGIDRDTKAAGESDGSPRGTVIAVINQKGGCGKTTTVVNLSACLAEAGKKVLIVDLDPQGHATLGFGVKLTAQEQSLYHMLVKEDLHISSIIKETNCPGVDIAPSNSLLASAQIDLINFVGRETLLRHNINAIKQKYNFIIIDCPPSLNLLTVNALVASEKVIVPIRTHYYSLDGMSELFKTIEVIKQRLNPNLKIMGILPTIFDGRTKVNHTILKALKDYFENNVRVFDSVIRNCISLVEAPMYGKPITKHRPKSRGAQDYRNLAAEMLAFEEKPASISDRLMLEDAAING